MRDLQVGDRVKTPVGEHVVIARGVDGSGVEHVETMHYLDAIRGQRVPSHEWLASDVEPLPRDIPREHVEMLHTAVSKRVDQLDDATCAHWPSADAVDYARAELAEVAEALRVLLEEEVRDGE